MQLNRWFVVQTKPQMEVVVSNSLNRSGFEYFSPLVKFKDCPIRPLYSRYIFIWLDNHSPWYGSVWRMYGVSRLLGGENPTPVVEGWVERLKAIVDGDDILQLNFSSDLLEFVPGDQIRVISGVFEGRMGICRWSNSAEVVVNLMMGSILNSVRMSSSTIVHEPPIPSRVNIL